MNTLTERIQTCDDILQQVILYLVSLLEQFSLVTIIFSFSFPFGPLDLMQVDDTLDLFNELQLQHQAVATKTKTLHDACDRLVWFHCLSP